MRGLVVCELDRETEIRRRMCGGLACLFGINRIGLVILYILGHNFILKKITMELNNILVPPLNFALVLPGIYRSGYPNPKNYPFLKSLGLTIIIYLGNIVTDDDISDRKRHY